LIVASECAAGLYPQNTLAGFQYCLDARVDGIEFDVHLSADGEVIVQHDYRINTDITRDSSGNWLEQPVKFICDSTLEELCTYDVGRYRDSSELNSNYPEYIPCDKEAIPTLEQFLDAVNAQNDSKCELWLELKTTPLDRRISSDPVKLLDAVLSKLDTAGLLERTILLAFEWNVLVRAKRLAPSIRTDFLSISTKVLKRFYPKSGVVALNAVYGEYQPDDFPSIPATIAAAGGDWWGPLIGEISLQGLLDAGEHGIRVNAWGVGSSDEAIRQAMAMGLDAITLARPDRARHLQK